MISFPRLKTGAVAQYPSSRTMAFSTQVMRFLDGSEQRYREQQGLLRRWVIRLDLLDDEERQRIQEFMEGVRGRCQMFAFEDPWSGATVPNCSLDNDELVVTAEAEGRSSAVMVVKENRT
jgi:hypothetical protein